jgi:hypothetical protein
VNIRRVHFVTLMLTVCFTLSYTDRHVLGLLVEPVKASLAMVLAAQMLRYVLAHSAAASARVDARAQEILQNNTEQGSNTVPGHEQHVGAAAVAATPGQDV